MHKFSLLIPATLLIGLLLSGCEEQVPLREAQLVPERFACAFDAGALPATTLGVDVPRGTEIKINHFIILLQDNRSFDHYFGALSAAGHVEVNGLPADAGNPDADGNLIRPFRTQQYCGPELPQDWRAAHTQYNGGANDGFVRTGGQQTMSYLGQDDVPFNFGLATTYAIADRFFSSMLGPTNPNRLFLLSGTSAGSTNNAPSTFRGQTIFDQLDAAGISWEIYSNGPDFAAVVDKSWSPMAKFYAQARNGTLPKVVYLDPGAQQGKANGQRAAHNIQLGQQTIESIYAAVLDSPLWPSIALLITNDQNGGYYDHVPPPKSCAPDRAGADSGLSDGDGDFDRYGFRVPLIVVSPWVRPGFVSHTTYDLTSILRLIQLRFDLPALTVRDANATPILDLFSFDRPRLLKPPVMPEARVDLRKAKACAEIN